MDAKGEVGMGSNVLFVPVTTATLDVCRRYGMVMVGVEGYGRSKYVMFVPVTMTTVDVCRRYGILR